MNFEDVGTGAGGAVRAPDEPGGHSRSSTSDERVSFVDEVQRQAESMRQSGRELIGTGGEVDRRPLRRLLREEGVSLYPLGALMALAFAQALHGEAWQVEQPDIARTFGLTPLFFNILDLVSQVLTLAVPIAVARYVQYRARRAQVALVSAAVFSILTPATGLATVVWVLVAMAVLDSVTSSADGTVSEPLTVDLFPPAVRVRAISALAVAGMIAGLAANGVVLVLTGPMNLNWRGVFVGLGILAMPLTLFAMRLRDPGYGRYDTERLRAAARGEVPDLAEQPVTREARGTRLSLSEAIRRIWTIKTMRVTLIGSVVGALSAPVNTYLAFFYANQFNLDAFERALLSGATSVVGILSYLVLAPVADRIFMRNPAKLFYLSGAMGIVGIVLSGAQVYSTSVTVLVVISLTSVALTGLFGPAMVVGSLSVVPAPLRPHVSAVTALFALAGTAVATALLGGVAASLGITMAVLVSSVIGVIAAVFGMIAGRSIIDDLDSMVEEVIEDEVISELRDRGVAIPMMALRGVDFSYGQTQVLFGVDFHVDEGEMVALLGVNGAGKSTLLRVISGLGIPQRGSVRLAGDDITFLDAHRRARLGITQVPGGRAVFADLTVVDNLRCYARRVGAGRREAERRMDEAFDAYPRLAERRTSLAGQLSGGEQQMLALAKATIMRPQLLLIDELSLGLAPLVVEQLLGMVRHINAQGTAVVIVEQSVNVALSVSDRACFMEQGQVMFDGPSSELLQQRDLLRSVFLSGFTGDDR